MSLRKPPLPRGAPCRSRIIAVLDCTSRRRFGWSVANHSQTWKRLLECGASAESGRNELVTPMTTG